ncbi:hypothetical protein CHS0354_012100 [Potamilus streckersoni]|uniref:Cytochrome P450 n=1 Tax=Potamilus streckersoni TaxID=2493646 RepID=A0AAE0SA33_9BIVA|nr:hypothetical protein CHS0354_012100 [Potamilus streckersoni]
MLEYAIFAVTFVLALLIAVIYLYPGSSKPTSIPGLEPTTKEDGNLADISRAGSLHEFLTDLHKKFGDVVSFWMGQKFVVSIASPELFKEHQGVFDRPSELFKLFEPMIGPKCIQYANGSDGRSRRTLYDKALSHDANRNYYQSFQEVANELANKWLTLTKEENVPLSMYMSAFSLKAVLITLFGKNIKDDKKILEFRRKYDVCWTEMERRLVESPDAKREKVLEDALSSLKKQIIEVIKDRKKIPPKTGEELLIDIILEKSEDEEIHLSDSIAFVVGGFHTTANLLTWAFYFLASHQDIQQKLYEEIQSVLGKEDVDHTNIGELVYLRQVQDETLRCGVVAPWAARFQDFDSELGGHKISKNTPVIHALGVVLQDEKIWPLPNKFDPDRFSPENTKKRPTLAFSPFGFAGKRICPGYRFSYAEASVCIVTLLKKFKVHMVKGQFVTPVYGLVTHPEEEIWITISKR